MKTFMEFVAWRKKSGLPDSVTLMAKMGIDPHGPHEVDFMRMMKDGKKRAAQAPPTYSRWIASGIGRKGLARTGSATG